MRQDTEFTAWTYKKLQIGDRPLPYLITFHAKTNVIGGLEGHKVCCAIRGDSMREGLDFYAAQTASHMPSQVGRRFLLSGTAAE